MKIVPLSSCCFVAAFIVIYDQQKVISAAKIEKRNSGTYSTKYDNIDIQRIVSSKRLMNNYGKCLLDKGPCTPEGTELRTYLPDALATKCSKCSDKQKKIAGIVLSELSDNYKNLFDDLLNKYDTEGTFRKEFEGLDDDAEDEEK